MPQVPAGQRAAQRPGRAATAVSRALGRTVSAGYLSEEVLVIPDGQAPFRIYLDQDGGEQQEPAVRGPRKQGGNDA